MVPVKVDLDKEVLAKEWDLVDKAVKVVLAKVWVLADKAVKVDLVKEWVLVDKVVPAWEALAEGAYLPKAH